MAESLRTHLLCGGDVLTPAGWQDFDLNVVDGMIAADSESSGEVIDVSGLRIVPGFIDLQINGGWGHDLERDPAELWALSARLVETGVTTFLPTLTTNGYALRREALAAWRDRPDEASFIGADPLGWHFEGPWLAPSRHGAHSRELMQAIPSVLPQDYSPESGVRLVTLAPELRGALEAIEELRRRGVVVSCGHSEATAEQARAGFDAGVTMGTHLFNAMSGLHHREVGLAAALLLRDDVYLGLIVDGEHVDPDMIRLVWRLAQDRVVAVSDAVAFMGTAGASATGSAVRLYDGTLAGSAVGLDQSVRNLIQYTDCGLSAALATVTEAPARCLGLADRGRIEVGLRADLAAIDDEGQVVMTLVDGRIAFDARD